MKIKSIRQAKKIGGKKVLLRADFNIPIKDGKIKDDFKIIACLPTIRFLLRYKCKIIIITHLGQPKKEEKKYSTEPIAEYLSKILDRKVKFIDECIGFKVGNVVSKMKEGEIIFLENVRFEAGEIKNDNKFAKGLSSLADIYVNDAFAVSHRRQATVSAIKKYLPAYAGLLLESEIINLNKVMRPKKPLIIVLGGAKIHTKIPLIKKLNKKAYKILIGGAIANNFLAAHNLEIGRSLADKESIVYAKKVKNKNIILPIDVIVNSKKDGSGKVTVKDIDKINKKEIILDIGPRTIHLYAHLIKKAQTIVWNGPMGMFERERFKYGTLGIARVIAARSSGKAFGVVGGGETIEALKMTKMFEYVDWVSTGGGAMLSYLSGERMPGLDGIYDW